MFTVFVHLAAFQLGSAERFVYTFLWVFQTKYKNSSAVIGDGITTRAKPFPYICTCCKPSVADDYQQITTMWKLGFTLKEKYICGHSVYNCYQTSSKAVGRRKNGR